MNWNPLCPGSRKVALPRKSSLLTLPCVRQAVSVILSRASILPCITLSNIPNQNHYLLTMEMLNPFITDCVASETIRKVFIILTQPIKERASFFLPVITLPDGQVRCSNIRNILPANMVLCLPRSVSEVSG